MAQRYIIICHKMLLKKIFFLMDDIFLVFNICAFLPLRLCDFARNNNPSDFYLTLISQSTLSSMNVSPNPLPLFPYPD